MDLKASAGKTIGIDNPFLRQIRQVTMTDILRDIKHGARIPIPGQLLACGCWQMKARLMQEKLALKTFIACQLAKYMVSL